MAVAKNAGRLLRCTWVLAAAAVAVLGCDPTTDPDANIQPTYSSIQANILTTTCASSSCHSSTSHKGNMILEAAVAYDNLVSVQADNLTARGKGLFRVAPGKPDSSFIMIKLTGPRSGEGDQMPQTGVRLSDKAIDAIRTWIANGAKRD